MVLNDLNVIFWGGEGGHGIEVQSESEQKKEPAKVDTLPSQLQSPPNFGDS